MLWMILIYAFFFVSLPFLVVLAVYDRFTSSRGVHLYGISGFFGLPGKGKTMAMCRELRRLRKKYGDKILITTNFNYRDEDFKFTTWKQLTQTYDRPLVVAWDEIQNEFNSRDFKNFPISLLTQLTQVRKGNGIKILYTSQRFGFVDKNFRSLSGYACDCSTVLGRFTVVKQYDCLDYEDLQNTVAVDRKMKIKPLFAYAFIQTKSLRDSYDSYAMLETAKYKANKGEFMGRDEIARINNNVS